jgi:hypothetical protein
MINHTITNESRRLQGGDHAGQFGHGHLWIGGGDFQTRQLLHRTAAALFELFAARVRISHNLQKTQPITLSCKKKAKQPTSGRIPASLAAKKP